MKLRVCVLVTVLLGCSMVAGANSLTDKPATVFYPEGHYLEGWPRQVGFDMYGYNYQAHKFQGYLPNVELGGDGLPPYNGDDAAYYQGLVEYGFFDSIEDAEAYLYTQWFWYYRLTHVRMSWNDAWLSNKDLVDSSGGGEPDGNLDRHRGYSSYFNSGATLVQYQVEPVEVVRKGKVKKANLYYYSELVAVSSDDILVYGVWYTPEGILLGPQAYGQFARVNTYIHDPRTDDSNPRGRAWGKRSRDVAF